MELCIEGDEWRIAAGWAQEFWRRVAADERVSPEFAVIAREAGLWVGEPLRLYSS